MGGKRRKITKKKEKKGATRLGRTGHRTSRQEKNLTPPSNLGFWVVGIPKSQGGKIPVFGASWGGWGLWGVKKRRKETGNHGSGFPILDGKWVSRNAKKRRSRKDPDHDY